MTEAKELSPEAKMALGTVPAAASEGVVSTQPQCDPLVHCSFCGKNNREVSAIIAAQPNFICDECVCTSMTIIAGFFRKKFTCSTLPFHRAEGRVTDAEAPQRVASNELSAAIERIRYG